MGWQFILLGIMISIAFYTDVKKAKIPNYISISGVLIGVFYHFIDKGPIGLWFSIKGLLIGFLILFALYLFGGIGAGDVKLFGAIGAITGLEFVLSSIIYSILYGGVIGILILLNRREFIRRIKAVFYYLIGLIFFKDVTSIQDYKRSGSLRFPFMYAVIPAIITSYIYYPI